MKYTFEPLQSLLIKVFEHYQGCIDPERPSAARYTPGIMQPVLQFFYMYMWQSRVENEHYSVAYFDRTRAFTTLYLRTSVKGGAHTCCVEASHIDATT